MSLLAAAIVTSSQITIRRAPIEFLEIELALLEEMGFNYDRSDEYLAENGHTRLVDITTHESTLHAPLDKVHPMPFPGLNIDNLPFFAVIAAVAEGQTMIHDWVYENRAIYLTELTKLGASVTLLDPHRVLVEGPTHWSAAELMCPPGAAAGRRHPARHDGGQGYVGAAQRLRDQPRLRGPGGAAERARRPDRDVPRHLSRRAGGSAAGPAPGQPKSSSTNDRACGVSRTTDGAVMPAVMRGIGCVEGPDDTCQSFSCSIISPRSARRRKTPSHATHWATVTPARWYCFISFSHCGQVIAAMAPR